MKHAIIVGLAIGAAAITGPAVAVAVEAPGATQQCRLESPVQAGPRAPLRPATWTCVAAMEREEACRRADLYWPHWLAQRAQAPIRREVLEPCRSAG